MTNTTVKTCQAEGNLMLYRNLPGLAKPVSRIVYGTVHLPTDDPASSLEILDAALACGMNTFDLGHIYGGGDLERMFGQWLSARGRRDEVVIISKCCHDNLDRKCVTPPDISANLYDSLARFKTDCIDIYLFHRDDPEVPVGPLVETMNEHLAAGRIACYGASNWTHTRIAEANAYAVKNGLIPLALSSPNFSLAHQVDSPWGDDCITISGTENVEAREWYAREQFPVFAWSSLARGFMTGRITRENLEQVRDQFEEHTLRCYAVEENFQRLDRLSELAAEKDVSIAQLAMAWVLQQPFPVHALVGTTDTEEMRQVLRVLSLELTAAERVWLDLGQTER